MRVADAVDAARIPLNPRYVGQLIRRGKVPGQRIGKNWFTTAEALKAALVQSAEGKA